MARNINELTAILKNEIEEYHSTVEIKEEGRVISAGDGIAIIHGLKNAMYYEKVIFSNKSVGIVLSLEEDSVGVVLLSGADTVRENDICYRTQKILSCPVGDNMIGRVVGALGNPIDGKGKIVAKEYRDVERIAPGVMTRQSVSQPLETGILAIDSLIPIGKGQRELIIGDRQTGKTAIAIDAIINQQDKNVYCIYVAIGQKNSTVTQIVNKLKQRDAMSYTTVLVASASELSPLQFIAPYSATAIAEYWMERGKDVLIVYDDLTKHAIAYRTLSLLLKMPPGREAYPGDVFYIHSRLLERSARLNSEYGGGSITALPIIETQAGDISAYIPTNVISITDGQIFLITDLFNSGQRPAISSGLSVSRVGGDAQIKSIKEMSSSLKLELAQYRELESFSQFGSDLDKTTLEILEHGARVVEYLKQKQYTPISQAHQALILFAIKKRLIKYIPVPNIALFKHQLLTVFSKKHANLIAKLKKTKVFSDDLQKIFHLQIYLFIESFINSELNLKEYDKELLTDLKLQIKRAHENKQEDKNPKLKTIQHDK